MFDCSDPVSLQFEESKLVECYKAVNEAICSALNAGNDPIPDKNTGRSTFLFNSPRFGRDAYEIHLSGKNNPNPNPYVDSYFADVPRPILFAELNKTELRKQINLFGLDIMRANFLSSNLVDTEHTPLLSGGACALETWATRILNQPSLQKNKGLRREALLHILDSAPYYTHITGAMMLGAHKSQSVLYDETFPWFLAIFDLGLTSDTDQHLWNSRVVKEITREVYDRIYTAVIRRSALFSSEGPHPIRLPFDKLNLEDDGHLKAWFAKYMSELPSELNQYKPSEYTPEKFIGAYVRYTYVGPDILRLVKDKLNIMIDAEKFTMHVRTKQDDHISEDRRINRILLQGMHEDDVGFLNKYANICNLAIYFWHKRNWNKGHNGFVGFTDLSLKGNIVHDTIDLTTGSNNKIKHEEDLWDILNSPLRLNRNNIEEHISCLEKYLNDLYVHEESIVELNFSETKVRKIEEKIKGVKKNIEERQLIKYILCELSRTHENKHISVSIDHNKLNKVFVEKSEEKLFKNLTQIYNRYKRKSKIACIPDSSILLNNLINLLMIDNKNDCVIIAVEGNLKPYKVILDNLISVLSDELNDYYKKIAHEEDLLTKNKQAYEKIANKLPNAVLDEIDLLVQKPCFFPLRDNLVFTHAVQLSFDANMCCFIIDAVDIERSSLAIEYKRSMLIKACRQIVPRIIAYLRFVMRGKLITDFKISCGAYQPVFSSVMRN